MLMDGVGEFDEVVVFVVVMMSWLNVIDFVFC